MEWSEKVQVRYFISNPGARELYCFITTQIAPERAIVFGISISSSIIRLIEIEHDINAFWCPAPVGSHNCSITFCEPGPLSCIFQRLQSLLFARPGFHIANLMKYDPPPLSESSDILIRLLSLGLLFARPWAGIYGWTLVLTPQNTLIGQRPRAF